MRRALSSAAVPMAVVGALIVIVLAVLVVTASGSGGDAYRVRAIFMDAFSAAAGQGAALRQAIRNADPALKETDKALAILAGQNRVLSQLAVDSDKIMAPLARERRHVAGFIVNANTTAEATAERSSALSQDIAKFPEFLRQLKPTMAGLGAFAGQATPVLTDLGKAAPNINTFFESLGPFSKEAVPAVDSLGNALDVGRVALVK